MTIGKAYGGIPSGLPALHLPHWTWEQCRQLMGPAFSVALLGAIESLLSAVVADGMLGTKHDANQELIGQGLANMIVPFFSGFAATGAIARTATSIRNGGNSPIAGVVHALTLVAIILFLAPLAGHVPLACLAAVLFMVCWNMSELHHCIKLIKQAPRSDVVIMIVTFLLTVLVDLVFAVQIGVLIAVLYFFLKMSQSIDVELNQLTHMTEPSDASQENTPGVLEFRLQGPFFFGAVERIEQAMQTHHEMIHTIILSFGWVPVMDITALRCLEKLINAWHHRGIVVKLTGVNPLIEKRMYRVGLLERIGKHNVFAS